MLDSTSVIMLVLGGVGLAVMVTMFLKRRRSNPIAQKLSAPQEPAITQHDAIDPLKAEPSSGQIPLQSVDEVQKAREELKALNLQRQIVTSALTAIFEAEAQGRISHGGRDSLVETYKSQLKALDDQIAEKKRITEASDLLSEKEELVKNFEKRMAEINERLKQFDTSVVRFPTTASENPQIGMVQATDAQLTSPGSNNGEERKSDEKTKNRTEERIQAIREEVLKAIERLEKIESEG
jgi:hypothetical protein